MIVEKKELLPGVWWLQTDLHCDERGFFRELYKENEWADLGLCTNWPQDNVSYSGRGVLRGLHYSPGQAKLVQVLVGHIQAVAFDTRPSSSVYGSHALVEMTFSSPSALYLPPGVAFGFSVMSTEAFVYYKVSTEYDPGASRAINPLDPALEIPWWTNSPKVSEADRTAPLWSRA